jgi:predicted transcriptional regulator
MCKNLLNSGKSVIDESVIIEIGEKDYVLDVLKSRFSDPSDVAILKKLFDIMVEKFDGFVPSQQEIAQEVNKQYGWDKKTVVRRLKNLIRVGLVIERRNADDQWRKEYLVRTRIPA